MSNAAYIKELLRPLCVYKLENSFLGAEVDSLGLALDQAQEVLERIQQEMCLTTARAEGLAAMSELFVRSPVTNDPQQMASSLASLMRIGADSFTLTAINDTICGCGLNAIALETDEPGVVIVRFPDTPGIPSGFDEMRCIIEDILPAHLLVRYLFWYVTWKELEGRLLTWQMVRAENMTWEEFETLME